MKQFGATPLNATYLTAKTATNRIFTQILGWRLAAIFTHMPTTTSVKDELFFEFLHIAPSAITTFRNYPPIPATLRGLRGEDTA